MSASSNLESEPKEMLSDNLLVLRAKKGDQEAFEILWCRYAPKIRSMSSRFVRQPADAEDLTQETFLKAYCALPGFRGQSQFYSWLYAIAFNT
ncbi:MAG: sigma factor, partial [Pseudomonadales bacterium]